MRGAGIDRGGSPEAGRLRDRRDRLMEPIPLIDSISAAAGCGARSHQFDSGDGESDLERPCHQLAFIDGIAHWKSMGFEASSGSRIPSNPCSRTGLHCSWTWHPLWGPCRDPSASPGKAPGAGVARWAAPGISAWRSHKAGLPLAPLHGGPAGHSHPASLHGGPTGHHHP